MLCIFLSNGQEDVSFVISVHNERVNKSTAVIKETNGNQGVALRTNEREEGYPVQPADVETSITVPKAGWYVLETDGNPVDIERLRKEDTTGLLTRHAYFQLGSARPTKRIVYNTHNGGKQTLGKFEITDKDQKLKIWLPNNLILNTITVKRYTPPTAPPEAEKYVPKVLPNKDRPRLWVNNESLPIVQERLQSAEHRVAWDSVKSIAKEPYPFSVESGREMFYDEQLEQVIEKKAFYYLMTADEAIGKEAVDLAVKYLSALEFGNVTYGDITRELGRAIYTGALVYDWCYPLIDSENKSGLRKDLMRLVHDMDIGWPPFYGLESIINGHGNEAQICRDMLSWSLAVYDEEPEHYKYISYTILEQLVPMRKFEYQSPRHNQGIDYGGYRFGWEMHAVWLYYRMLGYSVFDDNIKNMSDYWLYMRTPDGKMLRDGDMFNVQYSDGEEFYWKNPQTMLLSYAFTGDRLIKGEFYKQGGLPNNPVLFLLLNDPNMQPDYDLNQLSLTKDFGPVLGSMVARTGWSTEKESGDVIAEIKGGGYHFGNHQHADAGALQIYHHGIQVGDLGLYLSYGSPYDFNFNKRSIAHSMMLVRDLNEPLLFRTRTNDGGTRFSQRFPRSVDEVLNDSWYHTGSVRASAFGPDPIRPSYSFFNVDLTAAYTAKVKSYAKSFLFLNLNRKDIPAAIILLDELETNHADFQPYWQINTVEKPTVLPEGFALKSEVQGKSGTTYVDMLKPTALDREVLVYSGDSSAYVFGDLYQVESRWPESKGTRIMVNPKQKDTHASYATVFQMTEKPETKLPIEFVEETNYYRFKLADRIVIMAKADRYLNEEILIDIPGDQKYEIILVGLKHGFWNVRNTAKSSSFNLNITKDNHTASWKSTEGVIQLVPERVYGAPEGEY